MTQLAFTIYINSTTGLDSADRDGLTSETAFKTIQYAAQRSISLYQEVSMDQPQPIPPISSLTFMLEGTNAYPFEHGVFAELLEASRREKRVVSDIIQIIEAREPWSPTVTPSTISIEALRTAFSGNQPSQVRILQKEALETFISPARHKNRNAKNKSQSPFRHRGRER